MFKQNRKRYSRENQWKEEQTNTTDKSLQQHVTLAT